LRNIIFHTPRYYRWLTCYVCARLCQCFGQGGWNFRCDKPCTFNWTCIQRFLLLHSCAYVKTPSVNLACRPKLGLKNECRPRAGFGLVISGSGRVQASKWGPFPKLCVCRQGPIREIERIHSPPTNSKQIEIILWSRLR